MGSPADLFREILAILLIIAATVLAALGKMTTEQWTSFAQIVFGAYVAGKTVTGAVDLMTAHKRAGAGIGPAKPAPSPAPVNYPAPAA
jgi:hypothetical protein